MPAPSVATYSLQAKINAHTTFLALIDAGAGPGRIFIRSAADVLLAEIPLTDPAGTVSGGTGQLTITPSGPDTSANATGTAAYAEFADLAGTVHLSLPAQAGTAAVSGKIVINTLDIIAGGLVTVISATIG
jgi:hypothetical protein